MLKGVSSPKFFINTQLLYKIWFSKNPDIFMDELNILRLIRMKTLNPHATITIIYSAQCLSITALSKLKKFAQNLAINILDFDSELRSLIETELDQQLYQLADLEIANTLADTGGNFAAAANIVKTMLIVNEKFGIYSELDVNVNFGGYNKAHPVNSPCIINARMNYTHNMPMINNDFFALTYDTNELLEISSQALLKLTVLQIDMIENYRHPTALNLMEEIPDVGGKLSAWPILNKVIEIFFSQPNATIFQFRVFMNNLKLDRFPKDPQSPTAKADLCLMLIRKMFARYANGDDMLALLKHFLYINTVNCISGPKCLYYFFMNKNLLRLEPAADWKELGPQVISYGGAANGLAPAFIRENVPYIPHHYPSSAVMEELTFNDASWLPAGEDVLRQRSRIIDKRVCLIQSTLRQWDTKQAFKAALASMRAEKANAKQVASENPEARTVQGGMIHWASRGFKSLYSAFSYYRRPTLAESDDMVQEWPASSGDIEQGYKPSLTK